MDTLLIKNPWILKIDDDIRIIKKSIIIRNGIIEKIDDYKKLYREYKPDEVIDAESMLAMPGFVNVHTHVSMTLLRGVADEYSTLEWLRKIWKIEKWLTSQDIYYGALLGIIEMVKSGITCFSDHYFNEERVIEASLKVGTRIVACESVLETLNGPTYINVQEAFRRVIELKKKYKNHELVKIGLSPHSVYSVSLDTFKEVKNVAETYNLDIHIHIAETKKEVKMTLQKYGLTPVKLLEKIGILKENTLLAHVIHVNDDDINTIAKHNTKVAYIPTTAMKHGLGVPPVVRMIQKGITIGLGTDGPGSNNNLDIIEEMRIGLLLQRLYSNNPRIMKIDDIIKIATINGVKALSLEEKNIGKIKEGMKADLILINLEKPHLTPLHNIPSHIVFSTSQEDIDTVIVNGKVIMRNRRILTVDEHGVIRKVNKIFERLIDRVGGEIFMDREPTLKKCIAK